MNTTLKELIIALVVNILLKIIIVYLIPALPESDFKYMIVILSTVVLISLSLLIIDRIEDVENVSTLVYTSIITSLNILIEIYKYNPLEMN